jgi:hypothetical protein
MFWNVGQNNLEKRRAKWLKITAKGKLRFILLRTTVVAGVILAWLLFTRYQSYRDGTPLQTRILILNGAALFVLGIGVVFAKWEWIQNFLRSDPTDFTVRRQLFEHIAAGPASHILRSIYPFWPLMFLGTLLTPHATLIRYTEVGLALSAFALAMLWLDWYVVLRNLKRRAATEDQVIPRSHATS